MQKIIFVRNYKGYKLGDIAMIENNEAHSLIEGGIAELHKIKLVYEDKMMRPRRKKWR